MIISAGGGSEMKEGREVTLSIYRIACDPYEAMTHRSWRLGPRGTHCLQPLAGLHVVSSIVLAWLFRLNKVVVLTASFINNPWTIVPMYAFCLWFGFKITGSDAAVPDIAWADIGFRDMITLLRPFIWPYVAGTLAVGAVAATIGYGAFFWGVRRYRRDERS
jgi:uncharacterized protein (DUF2062 family)